MQAQIDIKEEVPASEYVKAADVNGIFLYRKDGYICCYLRIYPFNITLKNKQEKRAITEKLAASFKEDRRAFDYFTLPREIDLDKYKTLLKDKHNEIQSAGKKRIIGKMMKQCATLTNSGENFEHQHFIKIWKLGKDKRSTENELAERIHDFETRFKSVGIDCEVLTETEIVKVCNLYGNSLQASYEQVPDNLFYTSILQLLEAENTDEK